MNVQELARELHEQFEVKTRDDEERAFYTLKDDASQAAKDLVWLAHSKGEIMPDDYRYQYAVEALEAIAESDDPEQAAFDIEPDVYNSDLLAWLSSHQSRINYCDEAIEEDPQSATNGIMNIIGWGQYYEKRDVYDSVHGFLVGAIELYETLPE